MSFDPGQVMSEVEDSASRLEKAADVYSAAVERFEKAEQEYEFEMAKARMYADSTSMDPKTGRRPSQERRHDVALTLVQREHSGVYTEYFAAKADKEAQAVRFRALAASVSARQSLLRALSGS
jgi:hypothetical protein